LTVGPATPFSIRFAEKSRSTSVANSFNGSGRKRAYPRRQGGKALNSLACAQETADGVARDPLANLNRLEESRPGFHWRATQRLKELDFGSEEFEWQKPVIMEAVQRQFSLAVREVPRDKPESDTLTLKGSIRFENSPPLRLAQ
jgi:hypothetical protein